jgi:DNA-binding transcriptional LysR family regulator
MAHQLTPDISLFEMDLFVRASRLKSLRELARQLELKPAHVSKVIKRLETKLGTRLLKRSVSGVLLTPEGMELLKTAESICQLSDDLLPSLRRGGAGPEQRILSVGSISFLCRHYLVGCLIPLVNEKRNYRYRIVEFTHNELVSHGLNGAFEVAVHIESLQWTKTWTSRRLGPMKWGLYGRAGHPLLKRGHSVAEGEVVKYPFIVPTDWSSQGFTIGEDHCPLSWRERLKGHESSTAETAMELVAETDQLTFIPEVLTRRAVEEGQIQEIEVDGWPRVQKDIYVSVRSDLVSKQYLTALVEALQSGLGGQR